jgi:SpoVK/Ycf46/Vps4 family AAA+-type ATPase
MSDIDELNKLFACRHPCVSIQTYEESQALEIVRQAALQRGCDLWLWSISTGLRDGLLENGPSIAETENPAAALYRIVKDKFKGIIVMLDLCGSLREERAKRLLRDAIEAAQRNGSTLVLIDGEGTLPAVIAAMSTRFDLSLPAEPELDELVRSTLRQINAESRIEVALNRAELTTILRNLRGLSLRQARQIIIDAASHDRKFNAEDINHILALKRRALGSTGLLEYVESPVSLDQVGGLVKLKAWLEQRQCALSDEAAKHGITPPRGVLMLGVQGAGKSLAAKAVATAWHWPLLRLDVSSLYDRYIGESERRLRDALKQADSMAPIILWIDEIEKGFASAASQSSDGGLSKRMFGTLLTWMQERQSPVFLIATANDIEALPPELLRKGRFDEIFFVDLPSHESRQSIFKIHLKKRGREPEQFDLKTLADASDGFSGAEIEAAIVSALHNTFAKQLILSTEHVVSAIKASPPLSVTMREKVNELREWSKGRCVSAE